MGGTVKKNTLWILLNHMLHKIIPPPLQRCNQAEEANRQDGSRDLFWLHRSTRQQPEHRYMEIFFVGRNILSSVALFSALFAENKIMFHLVGTLFPQTSWCQLTWSISSSAFASTREFKWIKLNEFPDTKKDTCMHFIPKWVQIAKWPASSSPFWALSSSFIPASSNLHSSWCELKTQRRPLLLSNFETYWYDPHLPTDTPLQRCLWRFWKFQVGPPQLAQETALPSLKRKTNFCC